MKTKIINQFQICTLVFFMIRSTSLGIVMSSYLTFGKVDGYLSPIIGTVIGFIPLFIFLKYLNYKKNLNINEKNIFLFGNKIGFIINMILLSIVFLICIVLMLELTNFISSNYLDQTSKYIILGFFCIPLIYIVNKELKYILRTSNLLFYISIFLIFICFLGLFFQVDMTNILPILEHGLNGPLKGGLIHTSLCIMPLYILLIIPKKNYETKNTNKMIVYFYLIANITKIVLTFLLITIFGIDLASLYDFPEFQLLRRIMIGGFFERIDSILAIIWIIDCFIMLAICFYYIKETCTFIYKKNNHIFISSLIIIASFLSLTIFYNTIQSYDFIIYKLPFIIGIPLFIIYFIIFIKIKHKKT